MHATLATTALALTLATAAQAQSLGPGLATPATTPGQPAFLVEPIAETTVTTLPPGPLYWRVDSFPDLAAARRAAGPYALAAEAWGRAWLFTLGPPGGSAPGGRKAAEVGPVPVPAAPRYLLRVNRAGGPPGTATPVQTRARRPSTCSRATASRRSRRRPRCAAAGFP